MQGRSSTCQRVADDTPAAGAAGAALVVEPEAREVLAGWRAALVAREVLARAERSARTEARPVAEGEMPVGMVAGSVVGLEMACQ